VTTAVAATCAEGVVVGVDSLKLLHASGERPTSIVFRDKIHWLSERLSVVPSGTFLGPDGEHTFVAASSSATIDDVAPSVYAELRASSIPDRGLAERLDDPSIPDVFECLLVGGPAGSMPEVAVLRDGEPAAKLEPQTLVMTGMTRGWAKAHGLPVLRDNPEGTIAATAALVVATIRECIEWLYRLQGRGSLADYIGADPASGEQVMTPPAAFPVHLAIITPREVVVMTVPDPGGETA